MGKIEDIHIKRVKEGIYEMLKNVISDDISYPIKYENDYGKWEIREDGKAYVTPHKAAEYIELKITVTKDGLEFDDE